MSQEQQLKTALQKRSELQAKLTDIATKRRAILNDKAMEALLASKQPIPKQVKELLDQADAVKTEMGEVKASIRDLRDTLDAEKMVKAVKPGRTVEQVDADMAPLREQIRDLKTKLRQLEVERRMAITVAKINAMSPSEKAALTQVLQAQGIASAERFGKIGGK